MTMNIAYKNSKINEMKDETKSATRKVSLPMSAFITHDKYSDLYERSPHVVTLEQYDDCPTIQQKYIAA